MRHGSERGSVLVPVVLVVLLMATLTLMVQAAAVRSIRDVSFKSEDERLQAVGEAALDLAAAELWNGYRKNLAVDKRTLAGFRDHLAAAKIVHADPDSPEPIDLKALIGPTIFTSGGLYYAGARIHRLSVIREDRLTATSLRIRVALSFGRSETQRTVRTLERIYLAQGPKFKGFEFGLLANNVNCIMCHAAFDSTERYYNRDPAKYGTFDRVKIGTLEALKIRTDSADSTVAGTIYVRGVFTDRDGDLVTDPSSCGITSMVMDGDGKIVQDGSGDMTEAKLASATGEPLPALQNLYVDYPTEEGKQTDGEVPASFPAIIPDLNADHIVDDADFEVVASAAEGTLSEGVKVLVEAGSRFTGAGLPITDTAGELTGTVSGNLVLRGTADRPLEIDGRIVVDGDVVIEGTIKGDGEILARGNVYVVGPVLYADGEDEDGHRTFGVGADGKTNKLVLGAGGNILIGDFLRTKAVASDEPEFTDSDEGGGTTGETSPAPAWADFDTPYNGASDGTDSSSGNMAESEIVIFNRDQWTKTQPQLPDANGNPIDNPLYDPNYIPRYYTFYEGNPVYMMTGSDYYFDAKTKAWMGKEHVSGFYAATEYAPDDPEIKDAVISPLMSPSAWIDDTQIIKMAYESSQDHMGSPFEMDALLYTNNATFFIARANSPYNGQAIINGGLVGADLGILVPGNGGVGLQLNYDNRLKQVVKLRESVGLVLTRGPRLR